MTQRCNADRPSVEKLKPNGTGEKAWKIAGTIQQSPCEVSAFQLQCENPHLKGGLLNLWDENIMIPKILIRLKRPLLGGLLLFVLFFAIVLIHDALRRRVMFYDLPQKLSGRTEVIEVYYTMWACDCADFIETKHVDKNPNYEEKDEDYIFIEAARPELVVPESFYHEGRFKYKLRLTGQFYEDKGISRTYDRKTPEYYKPEKARVFRYEKFKFIRN